MLNSLKPAWETKVSNLLSGSSNRDNTSFHVDRYWRFSSEWLNVLEIVYQQGGRDSRIPMW